MKQPKEVWAYLNKRIKGEWKLAFFGVLILGLLIHMPILVRDIPNHDGLDSLYFDQNMITSGRWFLGAACGISSYYNLPWLIGMLSFVWMGLAAAALVEFLEVKGRGAILLVAGLLAAFPSVASNFAYVYTMDGYMLSFFLTILAVMLTKKYKKGFLPGALCLSFGMGIYQAYLPFAVILSLYGILQLALAEEKLRDKLRKALSYLGMGVLGMTVYYIILRVLLLIQGKELANYQGIDGMAAGKPGLLVSLQKMLSDFIDFTLRGKALVNNPFSGAAIMVLLVSVLIVLGCLICEKKSFKSLWLYGITFLFALGVPLGMNLILLISPGVNYHLLMRYQWVLFPILAVALVDRYAKETSLSKWGILIGGGILVFNFAVTDNIAYSNLQKKYEKTYAYCIRLLDRIEQTKGYYPGIPIAMVGVVGDENYPVTDLTASVTDQMIGMGGDYLFYTGENYLLYIRNYLGATLNILPPEAMREMYYSEEYISMQSFPGADSIRIIDGVMYIKTENSNR